MFKINILSSVIVSLLGIVYSNQVLAQTIENNNGTQPFRTIETIATGLLQPYGIAVDNTDLLITVNGGLLKITESGKLQPVATLTSGISSGVIIFGTDYIVVDNPADSLLRISRNGNINPIATNLDDPVGLAVQGSDFIVGNFGSGNGGLLRVGVDGSIFSIASTEVGGPTEVVVEGDNFYVTDFSFGRLLRVSTTGDVSEIATGLGQPLDIDFDGKDFIITDFANGFNDPGKGRILRVSKTGKVDTLLSGIGNPSGILIEKSNLLFTDIVNGTVNRIEGFFPTRSVPESSSELGLLGFGIFCIGMVVRSKMQASDKV